MIVITGAAGFIGSCLVTTLNRSGLTDLILVDDFSRKEKNKNIENAHFRYKVDRCLFNDWFEMEAKNISFVFHIGARTDTSEKDWNVFEVLNLDYSKRVWAICTRFKIPLVYASSAATYGDGTRGYDDEASIKSLMPLNPYGDSKHLFDLWALQQEDHPPLWVGFKFFNVYGPNEYHKGRMASVVYHTFMQITQTGQMKLFRSHKQGIEDGHQMRDFIYVKDVVSVCTYLYEKPIQNGIYNLGTGMARTFVDLANTTFDAMEKPRQISFIDTPIDIRNTYQYYTCASMDKLKGQGYTKPFKSLEEGINDYISNYLLQGLKSY